MSVTTVEDRLFAAEFQSVTRDKAGIGGEISLLLRARHFSRPLTDDDLIVEVRGDHEGPDRYLHPASLPVGALLACNETIRR
jgi:hypothetical protein